MSKKLFFALIIAGLCFGQSTESIPSYNFSLKIPRSMFVKPISQEENLILHNLRAHSLQFNMTSFNTMLMMQVEGESLQPKTSFWKQTGIYGLECMGAGIGTAISIYLAYFTEGGGDFDHPAYAILGYSIGQILFTSSCTWITGKLLRQKGSWRKSALATAFGCLTGIPAALLLNKIYPEGFMNGVSLGIFLVIPPSGAVIGFNIK